MANSSALAYHAHQIIITHHSNHNLYTMHMHMYMYSYKISGGKIYQGVFRGPTSVYNSVTVHTSNESTNGGPWEYGHDPELRTLMEKSTTGGKRITFTFNSLY